MHGCGLLHQESVAGKDMLCSCPAQKHQLQPGILSRRSLKPSRCGIYLLQDRITILQDGGALHVGQHVPAMQDKTRQYCWGRQNVQNDVYGACIATACFSAAAQRWYLCSHCSSCSLTSWGSSSCGQCPTPACNLHALVTHAIRVSSVIPDLCQATSDIQGSSGSHTVQHHKIRVRPRVHSGL